MGGTLGFIVNFHGNDRKQSERLASLSVFMGVIKNNQNASLKFFIIG